MTAELVEATSAKRRVTTRSCPRCLAEDHDADALFCKACGARLEPAVRG